MSITNVDATIRGLVEIEKEDQQESIKIEARAGFLKRVGHQLNIVQLGAFCNEVNKELEYCVVNRPDKISVDELSALIRDRAAQKGLRPQDELIK